MLNNDWNNLLIDEFKKDYFKKLIIFINDEYNKKIIYPDYSNIFKALESTNYKDVKVVILGQDPYHGVGEANGLCFSTAKGIKKPPSLKNIFKELKSDLNIDAPDHGNLESWAREGILLLNSVLTVEKDKPGSHSNVGWELFTNEMIRLLNEKEDPIVFLLWGNYAKQKKELINNSNHLILESSHPSPFSANKGFFGSKPFSKINNFLEKNNKKVINWKIE